MTRNLIADVIVRTARSINARSLDVAFADAEGRQHTVRINAAWRALGSVRTFITFGLILLLLLPLMIIVALAAASLENEACARANQDQVDGMTQSPSCMLGSSVPSAWQLGALKHSIS